MANITKIKIDGVEHQIGYGAELEWKLVASGEIVKADEYNVKIENITIEPKKQYILRMYNEPNAIFDTYNLCFIEESDYIYCNAMDNDEHPTPATFFYDKILNELRLSNSNENGLFYGSGNEYELYELVIKNVANPSNVGIGSEVQAELDKKANKTEVLKNINFEETYMYEVETFMYNLVDLYYKGELENNKFYMVNERYIANITFIGSGCLVRLIDLMNHYFHDSENPINQSTDIKSITYRTTYYQEELRDGTGIFITDDNIITTTYTQVFEYSPSLRTDGMVLEYNANTNFNIFVEINIHGSYSQYYLHFETGQCLLYSCSQNKDVDIAELFNSFSLGGSITATNVLYLEDTIQFGYGDTITLTYTPGDFTTGYDL